MRLFTIGFTKKSARVFFTKLADSGARKLIDVRLNNVSQLAGFTKKEDLSYFVDTICRIEYLHLPMLAPTQLMLDEYKKHKGEWSKYETDFLQLLASRQVENVLKREQLSDGCLLCSEDRADHCHRRLVAEYLKSKWGDVEIIHL
jgi:uncharacterized protein (DUF488 family)